MRCWVRWGVLPASSLLLACPGGGGADGGSADSGSTGAPTSSITNITSITNVTVDASTSGSDGSADTTGGTEEPTGDSSSTGDDTTGGEELGDRAVIYQLVVRHFGNTNQTRAVDGSIDDNGVGKFADIDEVAIGELLDLGITHVWLTGVLRQATLTAYPGLPADDPDIVKGRAGSFYAVRDYYDVSPDYALDPDMRLEEFDDLVDRFHAAGVTVLIDLVPNHVARSYASVVEPAADFGTSDDQSAFFDPGNNFFYLPGQSLTLTRPAEWNPPGFVFDGVFEPENGAPGSTPKVTGNNQATAAPSDTDWYETIKLNWGFDFTTGTGVYNPIPDTWQKMDAIVAYWQGRGVDGFRCDFAHFVPGEAWAWLIEQARMRDPEAYFLAEAFADLDGLLAAGFDAVYHDDGYDGLKRIYQGAGSQDDYATIMFGLGDDVRARYLQYLENHDERRIASPIEPMGGPDDSGFGSMQAGYQLAPIAFLFSAGPILMYNGQEVGEAGAGVEGFGQDDGRTSIFDYWSLPALSAWVNGGAFDGGGLSAAQADLRNYYADLLTLSRDPSVVGSSYWGLEYFNNPGMFADVPDGFYTFARFEPGSARAVVVVANFAPGMSSAGPVRMPPELVAAIGLTGEVSVRRVLGREGRVEQEIATIDSGDLTTLGFLADVPDQTTFVYVVE
ncbi:MAG: alpha-amylase family glycosyl hydrolase [Myxococcota bacterium]